MGRADVAQSRAGLFTGLAIKIGVSIVFVELLILGFMGAYYIDHFSEEIDLRAADRLMSPGLLIQSKALSFSVIDDDERMKELVGPGLTDAMVIGSNKRVFFALHKKNIGKTLAELPHLQESWFEPDLKGPKLIKTEEAGVDYLVAVTPFRNFGTQRPRFFIYLKTSTEAMTASKEEVAALVIGGSAFCIFLTSAMILWAVRYSVLSRLTEALSFVGKVARGDFKARLEVKGRDELALLEAHMNNMVEDLARRTEQRETAETALRLSEERFRDFTESSADWQWEVDEHLQYTFVSLNFYTKTQSYGNPIGKRIDEFGMTLENDDGWEGLLIRMHNRLSFQDMVVSWTDDSGEPVYARINGIPVFSEPGVLAGYRGTGTDITHQRLAEAEHSRLQKQLSMAQKMEAVGQMAGGVAHEFNNCLAGILSFTELAHGMMDDREKVSEYITQIEKLGQRAASVADELLIFSRKQETHPRVVRIDTAIQDMATLIDTILESRVSLQMWHDAGPVHANVDPTQLQNSIMNLAINARDAMPQGGTLQISTSLGPRLDLEGTSTDETEYVQIVVQDTGTGMDEQTLERIFEPFYTTKEPGKGTGLGLALVYGWVEQSGGILDVDSEPGAGTTFSIYLPVAEALPASPNIEQESSVARQDPSRLDGQPGETILLVDDEQAIRETSKLSLESRGYTVLAATNGQEALALVDDDAVRVDMVLSDVVMPQMTGPQMALELVKTRPGLPVVFMSGYPARIKSQIENFPNHSGLLKKPFRQADLLGQVRKTLDERALSVRPKNQRVS